MLGTTVPKAAVNEDGNTRTWEHEVSLASKSRKNAAMQAKAKPSLV
jgi:hypothetical protein